MKTESVKLYDLSIVSNLCRGDQERITHMVRTFTESIPLSVEKIKDAYRKKNLSEVSREAHHIKPVLSIYAMVTLEKEIKQIEQLSKEEIDTPELISGIEKLDATIRQVVINMKDQILS